MKVCVSVSATCFGSSPNESFVPIKIGTAAWLPRRQVTRVGWASFWSVLRSQAPETMLNLLNLTWPGGKKKQNLPQDLLRNLPPEPVEPDLVLHHGFLQTSPKPFPETCWTRPRFAPKPPRSSPEPSPEPCWTWPGSAPKPSRPSPRPFLEPSPEPCWTSPGLAPRPPRSFPEPFPETCWTWCSFAPKPPRPLDLRFGIFPQKLELMRSSAQNRSRVHQYRRRGRFFFFPRTFLLRKFGQWRPFFFWPVPRCATNPRLTVFNLVCPQVANPVRWLGEEVGWLVGVLAGSGREARWRRVECPRRWLHWRHHSLARMLHKQ